MKNNTALRVLFFSNGIFVFAAAALAPIYALFAENIGADLFTISTLTATMLGTKLIAIQVIRKYGDSVAEREYMLLAGFLIRAIAWGSLAFASGIGFLFVVQILLGIGEAVGSPAFGALIATHVDDGHEVAEYSDWEIIASIAGAIGAVAGGLVVSTYGFPILFFAMSVLALISFTLVLVQPRKLL